MKIIKFDKPRLGTVRVAACAVMDDSWFDSGAKLAHDQIINAHAAYEKFAT